MSAFEAGLATLPAAAAMIADHAGHHAAGGQDRRRAGRSALGFALATVGFAVLAFVDASWTYVAFVGPLLVLSVGLGLANGPASSGSTAAVSRRPGRLGRRDLEHGALRRRRRGRGRDRDGQQRGREQPQGCRRVRRRTRSPRGSRACALMMAIWSAAGVALIAPAAAPPPDGHAGGRPRGRRGLDRAHDPDRARATTAASCMRTRKEPMPADELRGAVKALMGRAKDDLAELVVVPVGRRPQAVPAGGVREGGAVGRRRVRRRRAAGRPHVADARRLATACTATRPARRARRPCCSTATTTSSRRSARTPGRCRCSS